METTGIIGLFVSILNPIRDVEVWGLGFGAVRVWDLGSRVWGLSFMG